MGNFSFLKKPVLYGQKFEEEVFILKALQARVNNILVEFMVKQKQMPVKNDKYIRIIS